MNSIGPYQLVELIGKGGMSLVYRAHQASVERDVAIKILAPELAIDPEFVARFEREAQIVSHLQHPYILPVYDFGHEDGKTYLVMQLMQGGTLAEELRKGALPPMRVIELAQQIGSALGYAHKRGIVHRDLKPTNILLDTLGNAYLTDFGIAKLLSGGTSTGLTATGVVMGTPTYMAPEQWRAEPVDGRTDIYALGVILYQMLLGQVPFAAETPHGLMYQHLDMQPPAPHLIRPDVPISVEPVLAKALAKNRAERYASAEQVADDLERALTTPPDRLPEQSLWEPAPPLYVPPPPPQSLIQPSEPIYPVQAPPPPPPPVYHEPESHLGRWLGVMAVGIVGLVVLIGVIWLLSQPSESTNTDSPFDNPAASPTIAPSETPANRPIIQIINPVGNIGMSLGDTLDIEFSAAGVSGITRVDLQRFGQTLDSLSGGGQTTFQGHFSYMPDSTGMHEISLIPWSGDVPGEAAVLMISVQ